MRLLALGLFALALASAADAQRVYTQPLEPEPGATFVVPSLPGEAVRVTTYDRRPPQRGRLARRYVGLRANRSPQTMRTVRARPVTPILRTPSGDFIRRGTSYFPVIRAR